MVLRQRLAPRHTVPDMAVAEFVEIVLCNLENRFDFAVGEVVDRDKMARRELRRHVDLGKEGITLK